jgi:hypothetical protein
MQSVCAHSQSSGSNSAGSSTVVEARRQQEIVDDLAEPLRLPRDELEEVAALRGAQPDVGTEQRLGCYVSQPPQTIAPGKTGRFWLRGAAAPAAIAFGGRDTRLVGL